MGLIIDDTVSIDLNLELYKKLYLIRTVEEKIRELYHEDEMKTPVHLSIGAEAISVGVCSALKPDDQVFGTYRSHGIYLSITGETDKFFAELYGRQTGLAAGKAGSMHLTAPEAGFLGTSAIVGSIIPVAVGAAYANKVRGNDKVVAVFFGDGATEEGVFWESLNAACLMKLRVLFVCEDNELAVFTHRAHRQGHNSLGRIVENFNCDVVEEKATDVEVVYELTNNAIKGIHENQRPCFLQLRYYRYLEHVGVEEDYDAGYRSRDEFEKWYREDPVNMQREKLLSLGVKQEQAEKFEKEIDGKIADSIRMAKKAPFSKISELDSHVFCENGKKN